MILRLALGRRDDLKTLSPTYFAMVMATGIIALSAHLHDLADVARVLFWLNALFLTGLVAATAVRMLVHLPAFSADLRSHGRGVGFFTIPAAVAVFGTEIDLQLGDVPLATVFWAIAAILLLVVTYGVLPMLMARHDKPSLAHGLNGGWLVTVVAPQSVAILAVLLLARGAFASVAPIWISTLIVYRYAFVVLGPKDLLPTDWINMGAAAISALAGATLAQHATLSPIVVDIAPFVKGLTLLFWAVASAWIPMLVVLGVWRHLICGLPITYEALDWGGLFPLGMYSVSTLSLADILNAPYLAAVSWAFMVIALAAWLWVLLGLIGSRFGGRVPS
jgi:tellurite resistance protein TehA-like permease